MDQVDALVIKEIHEDSNFCRIVDDKVPIDEFTRLVEEHVQGYTQKKRLSEGLKTFITKVEAAENRLVVARNVGKFKAPDPEDKALTDLCESGVLKEKSKVLTDQMNSQCEEGRVADSEKPQVLESLRTRLAKAKETGKAKLEEKLDRMISAVAKALYFIPPISNVARFHELTNEIKAIEKLEKLPAKHVTAALRERISGKQALQDEFDALYQQSAMWFETEVEFKPRFDKGMEAYAVQEADRIRREEEEAFELQRRAEDEALERKRLEAQRKEEEKQKAMEAQLEARRLKDLKQEHQNVTAKLEEFDPELLKDAPEVNLGDVTELRKEVQRLQELLAPLVDAPKKKEKPTTARVDLQHMFHDEIEAEATTKAQMEADLLAEAQQQEWAIAMAEMSKQMAEVKREQAAVRALPTPEKVTKSKVASKPVAKSQWGVVEQYESMKLAELQSRMSDKPAPAAPQSATKHMTAEEKDKAKEDKLKAIEEKLAAKRAEAQAKPQKEAPAPQPKKKDKKAATKMSLLDFYDQEIVDEKEAAAEKEAEEKRAAREAAELAAQEAEETEKADTMGDAAEVEVQETKAAPKVAEKKVAAKPKPKPKPKPVEIESKWGVTANATQQGGQDDEGAEDGAGPSLAESIAAVPVKKTAPPQPKKKEKKKWGKADASLIGFDTDNPNVYA
jgi:hypothetical protein